MVDESDPRLATLLEERRRTGRFRGELFCKRKDGTKFLAELSSAVFQDEDGQKRTIIIFRDVTERKRAEEMQAAQGRFRQALLDTLPAHIAVWDEQGGIVAVNEPWKRFARENGGTAEEKLAVGASYLQACRNATRTGDEYAVCVLTGLEALLSGARMRFDGKEVFAKNGGIVWIRLSGRVLRNELGQALYFLALMENINDFFVCPFPTLATA